MRIPRRLSLATAALAVAAISFCAGPSSAQAAQEPVSGPIIEQEFVDLGCVDDVPGAATVRVRLTNVHSAAAHIRLGDWKLYLYVDPDVNDPNVDLSEGTLVAEGDLFDGMASMASPVVIQPGESIELDIEIPGDAGTFLFWTRLLGGVEDNVWGFNRGSRTWLERQQCADPDATVDETGPDEPGPDETGPGTDHTGPESSNDGPNGHAEPAAIPSTTPRYLG